MKRKPTFANIGEISSGTLRAEDLLDSFAWELRHQLKRCRVTREQRKRMTKLVRDAADAVFDEDSGEVTLHGDTFDASELVTELEDALGELAPPYTHFGTLEGDGACFGFWPSVDMHGDDLPRLPAGDEVPAEYRGEDVLFVNDHGNVTCAHVNRNGSINVYWEVV